MLLIVLNLLIVLTFIDRIKCYWYINRKTLDIFFFTYFLMFCMEDSENWLGMLGVC